MKVEIKKVVFEDLKEGDIILFLRNYFGIVYYKGRTFIHKHKFIIVKIFCIDYDTLTSYKQKFYAHHKRFFNKLIIKEK